VLSSLLTPNSMTLSANSLAASSSVAGVAHQHELATQVAVAVVAERATHGSECALAGTAALFVDVGALHARHEVVHLRGQRLEALLLGRELVVLVAQLVSLVLAVEPVLEHSPGCAGSRAGSTP